MKPTDMRAAIERLEIADDTLRVTAALRIAVRALEWYAKTSNWREDEWGCESSVIEPPDYGRGGLKARNAIKRIEKQFDHDATPSPLALREKAR